MKLRFNVNQAECLRRGVDCPKSIVTIDVDPSKLHQKEREMLAVRLSGGINIYKYNIASLSGVARFIEALDPTYEGLIAAVKADEAERMKLQPPQA